MKTVKRSVLRVKVNQVLTVAQQDLLIQINTRPHATLKRDGNDLICPVTTDFVTAALGGEVEIQTLESRFKLKVPAGTQNGRKFRMKEKRCEKP